MFSLKDKVVVITGAANGIGAAVVRLLVQHETKHVRVLDIDDKAGNSLELEIYKKYDDFKIKFSKCDIAKEDKLFEEFEDVKNKYGSIDLVVNNAAVTDESSIENIRKIIDINVTALVHSTVKAIELMRKDKGGKGGTVINISSIAAMMQLCPFLFVYSAAKSAVLHFSNCIGKEPYHAKTGVRVLTVCYGGTKTDIIDQMACFDHEINLKDKIALYEIQTPEDAALETIEVFKRGKSGSTWLIKNAKPAKDITSTIENVFAEMTKLVLED